jgi:hypothetical protein
MKEVRMTRLLLALATAGTLTMSQALAQSSPPPSTSAAGGDKAASDHATNVQSSPGASANVPGGAITAQTADQWLASKFKGTTVIGPDDAKIGSVEDLLFDRTGSVKAVVVGVGGFLGIGSKQVAMALPSFTVVAGKDGAADQLRLSMTKDQLASAPEFKPYEPPRAASTSQPRPTTSGSGGMARPPSGSQ